MKKWIALLLSLVLALSLCACNHKESSDGSSSSTDSSSDSTSERKKDTLTYDAIEALVVNALYQEIDSTYTTADPGSCSYAINTTETNGDFTYVYGSVTLYDKYGRATGGWSDGSGTPFRSFTIQINGRTGRVTSCKIQ